MTNTIKDERGFRIEINDIDGQSLYEYKIYNKDLKLIKSIISTKPFEDPGQKFFIQNYLDESVFRNIDVKIQYLEHYNKEWGLMEYAKEGDAGFDLRSATIAPITLYGNMYRIEKWDMKDDKFSSMYKDSYQTIVPTGIKVAVPDGYQLEVRPRSGMAAKHGITVVNTPGTVDSGYRGEIKVILFNLGEESIIINPGDRIAQAVIMPVYKANFVVVDSLDETDRGEGGLGSTGKK